MKNILSILLYIGFFTSILSADAMRIEMGLGSWSQSSSGELSYSDGSGNSGSDKSRELEETQAYIWALIKHPIPVLPNFRLEYVNLKNSGLATGTFKNFVVPTSSQTTIDLREIDVIPYYNLLDNTAWITLDLGVDFKISEVTYEAEAVSVPMVGSFVNYSTTESIVLPLLYVRARLEIPATQIGLESDVKYITYSGATIYEARVKFDYTLDITFPIEPGFEIGYRVQSMKYDDSMEDGKVDLDFSGVYVGLIFRY